MTIKDIAKNLNVSTATVSRAINGTGRIKKETKETILNYIEKIRYIPNTIAINFSKKESRDIAIIIPDIANVFFSNLVSSVCKRYKDKNYNIVLYNTLDSIIIESEIIKNIVGKRVNTVIIVPVLSDYEVNPLLPIIEAKISCILLDRDLENINVNGVFLNNFRGSYEITKQLLKEGHRDIGIIIGKEKITSSEERLRGYLEAFKEFQIKVKKNNIYRGEFNIESGEKGIKYFFKKNITAFYAINNQIFLGALKILAKEKKEIRLSCFENIDILDVLGYDVLSCEIPIEKIVDSLIEIFEKKIEGKIYIEPILKIKK
ncbi:MAG: LacI family DNA-binding transcriptional regulator [Fusobacteriaceae bacterium]